MKYSNIRKKLSIDSNDNMNELAYVTHYLHNLADNSCVLREPASSYLLDNYKLSVQDILPLEWDIPFPAPLNPEFTFIDLFSGIGGFRIPLQELGGKCLFSSEFNSYAQKAYELNFGEVPFGDIEEIPMDIIPTHDISRTRSVPPSD